MLTYMHTTGGGVGPGRRMEAAGGLLHAGHGADAPDLVREAAGGAASLAQNADWHDGSSRARLLSGDQQTHGPQFLARRVIAGLVGKM